MGIEIMNGADSPADAVIWQFLAAMLAEDQYWAYVGAMMRLAPTDPTKPTRKQAEAALTTYRSARASAIAAAEEYLEGKS